MGPRKSDRAKKPGGLKPLHELFAYRVLEGASAAEAYRRCYPKAKASTAETQGPALLRKPQVAAFVEERRAKVLQRAAVTAEVKLERVLLEVNRILLADPLEALNEEGGVKPMSEWPEDLRRALSGIEVEEIWSGRGNDREQIGELKKIRFWSKTEASAQLFRHLGAFKDRLEVTDAGVSVEEITPEEWEAVALLRHKVREAKGA